MPKMQTTRPRKSPRNTLSLQQLHALQQGPQEEETHLCPLTAREEEACLALSPEIQELFKAAMTVGDFNDEVEPTSAENVHRILGWRPETPVQHRQRQNQMARMSTRATAPKTIKKPAPATREFRDKKFLKDWENNKLNKWNSEYRGDRMTRCNTWSCSVAVEQHLNTETIWKEPPFGGETESLTFHPKEREPSSYKNWLKKRCSKEGLCYLALYKRRYRWSVFLQHGYKPLLHELALDTIDRKYLSTAFAELNIAVNYPCSMIHVYYHTNVIYEHGFQKMKDNNDIFSWGSHKMFHVGSTSTQTLTQAQVVFRDNRTEERIGRGEAHIMNEDN